MSGTMKEGTSARRPESFLPLHALEFRILLVLLEGPSHGYRIVKEIEERSTSPGRRIYPANLYRRIRNLLDSGLIEEIEDPAGGSDARRRTHVRVSDLGRSVARAEAQRLERLILEARRSRLLEKAP